jgi:c-di-GMP-related signal transduction protein
MEVFVARHPIFDRKKQVFAYDLAFRSGFEQFYETVVSNRAQVDHEIAVNLEDLSGHGRGMVSFSLDLLRQGLPTLFPTETLCVCIPPDLSVDEEVLQACANLRDAGYPLVMDGLTPDRLDSPLLGLAQIARLDQATSASDRCGEICRAIAELGVAAIAVGIDTPEAYQVARDNGCSYFEGDFFRKPVLGPGRAVVSNQLNYMRILCAVNKPVLDYDELDALIKQDIAMTYKLLRFINSAWYGLRNRVDSIRHALVLLGPAEVRVWASLLVLKEAGSEKPNELFRRSLTRAQVAEKLAPLVGMESNASELFLMGMFSMVDALTDVPMEKVLDGLPLNEHIKSALLGEDGEFRHVHDAILSYEMGEWSDFARAAGELGLAEESVPGLFRTSDEWAAEALAAM